MSDSSAICIVRPSEFDKGTLQTPGSERLAAVAPQLGVESTMWGGMFEVKPGARTGIHHHGEQQTIAYVLSGVCEVRWGANGDGRRINSCLTLAAMHDGEPITTIEGLADGKTLHPLQAAFIEHEGFQCGYCTSGQICSAMGMLGESRAGAPSYVTENLAEAQPALTDAEIRERMSGNICRCAAYPNILAAFKQAAGAPT